MLRSFVLTRREWPLLAAFILVISAVTSAERARLIPLSVLAASPHAIAEARIWLLVTSALLVQAPYFWSVLTFGLLGALGLAVCGGRVLWISALAEHIGSKGRLTASDPEKPYNKAIEENKRVLETDGGFQ